MADPILEIDDLQLEFESRRGPAKVLNGVDITIERGETAALVGETGCGKSVTVKSILGLLPSPPARITGGEIRFNGQNLLDLSPDELRQKRGKEISMIMQDPMSSLNPMLTVGEQMMDVLKWQGKARVRLTDWVADKFRDHSEKRKQILDMLERVQISSPERVFSSYPVQLSGGMRQRVLIAIALLTQPSLLIADEPGTALDVTTEAEILELLNRMIDETGSTVLYITHDLGVAREVSDQINVMYAGEVVERAPTYELFEDPKHPYTRGLLDSIPKLSSGIGDGIPGELPDYTSPPKACRFYERCPHAEDVCDTVAPTRRSVSTDHGVSCHLYCDSSEQGTDVPVDDTYIGPPPWFDDETAVTASDDVDESTAGGE